MSLPAKTRHSARHVSETWTSERRARLAKVRDTHVMKPGLRARLRSVDPQQARQAYMVEQLAVSARLTAAMAGASVVEDLLQSVVDELHHSFGVYLAVIQRLDDDRVLRVAAGAGPLAEVLAEFLLDRQHIDVGVNGRVARTGTPSLVGDTRLDVDYVVRDPATDPLSELAVPILVEGVVWGVLNLEEVHAGAFDEGDAALMATVATQLGAALHRIRLYTELEDALVTMLSVLGGAMEARDAYTAEHEEAVATLAVALAAELEISPTDQRSIRYAALTHDIGKVVVPNEVLHKPGPFDEHEWKIMRAHAAVGADLLSRIRFFEAVHPLVRAHHERWDGRGYPDGLAGSAIPLGARVLSVCDGYNAMVTDRPYRPAMTPQAAIGEIRRSAGTQYDPEVVSAFMRVVGDNGRVA